MLDRSCVPPPLQPPAAERSASGPRLRDIQPRPHVAGTRPGTSSSERYADVGQHRRSRHGGPAAGQTRRWRLCWRRPIRQSRRRAVHAPLGVRRPPGAPRRRPIAWRTWRTTLDALGWYTAHLVGQSVSGMVAQTMAIRHPSRVLSLTPISSSPSPRIGRASLKTAIRLLIANPAGLMKRPPTTPEEAGERLVGAFRIIGSPGYPLDGNWLRAVGRRVYERGLELAGAQRHNAAILASGDPDRDPCQAGLPTSRQLSLPPWPVRPPAAPSGRPLRGARVWAPGRQR